MKSKVVLLTLFVAVLSAALLFMYYRSEPEGRIWKMKDFVQFNVDDPIGQDRISPGHIKVRLKDYSGIRVLYLAEKSVLREMSFQVGDLVTEINGEAPKNVDDLKVILQKFLRGSAISLEYYRKHEKHIFAAQLR